MKKTLRKALCFALILCMAIVAAPRTAQAASVGISASSTNITLGQSVTITVTVSAGNLGSFVCSLTGGIGNVTNSTDPPGAGSLSSSKNN